MNNIKLTPITNPHGTTDLVYSSETDETEIEITPKNFMSFTIHSQEQLELCMQKAEKYQVDNLWIRVMRDNVSLDFANIPYISQIKILEFEIMGKKFSLNILPKNQTELPAMVWFMFYADYPCHFDQFEVFINLKRLEIIGHKNAMSWTKLSHLVDLFIFKLKVDDLIPLSGLKSLKRLHLKRISIKSLNGIGNLTNLETLYVDDLRYLTDVSNLVDNKTLENIRFILFKKVTDWEFLVNMPQLKLIGLDVADSIGFMEKMPNLVCAWCVKVKDKNEEILAKIDRLYNYDATSSTYNTDSTLCKIQYNKAFTIKRFVELEQNKCHPKPTASSLFII